MARIAALAVLGSLMGFSVQAEDWLQWSTIAWHVRGPAHLRGVAALGGVGGLVSPERVGPLTPEAVTRNVSPYVATHQRFFVENIATDFYAPYHRWWPDRDPSAAFTDLQARHQAAPADPAVWRREPSLDDPVWRDRIARRLAAHVRAYRRYRPLYYSLGDETGIGDLSAAWDFDLSPASLAGFRRWLRGHYPSLAALNAQWGSDFAAWGAVMPLLTDAARARLRDGDGNLSGWGDFKAYMDVAFARALRAGSDAVHAADPSARAAIEGAQMPGWGGYDYSLLAHAVDVMEAYDMGFSIDIARAMNPGLVLLTTGFEGGPREVWRLWHSALQGARGVVIWDETGDFVGADGAVGARGASLADDLRLLAGMLGRQLIAARPDPGAVGLVYSPASFRAGWIEDHAGDEGWARRSAEAELADDALRVATRSAAEALLQAGIAFHWIGPAELAGPPRAGEKVVILPHVLALSDREVAALRARVGRGEQLLGDVLPGTYDAHLRRRAAAPSLPVRLVPGLDRQVLRAALPAVVQPSWRVEGGAGGAGDVTIRVLRRGGRIILGIEGTQPGVVPEPSRVLTVRFDRPRAVRDLGGGEAERVRDRLEVRLVGGRPALLSLGPERPLH